MKKYVNITMIFYLVLCGFLTSCVSNHYDSIVLRAETKEDERRAILTPKEVKKLVEDGISVLVERSTDRIFPDDAYEVVGGKLVEPGYWKNLGDNKKILVAGLKELPEELTPINQDHIFFSHSFKGQGGAKEIIERFKSGNSTIIDLEFLVDDQNVRVAAFGYWSGQAGMYLGLWRWADRILGVEAELSNEGIIDVKSKGLTSDAAVEILKVKITQAIESNGNQQPIVMVTGASGRSGTGAVDMAKRLGILDENIMKWGRAETGNEENRRKMVTIPDVFVNCVFTAPNAVIDPFITPEDIARDNIKLKVVVDVTADFGKLNRLTFNTAGETTFKKAVRPVKAGGNTVDLIAIDHLPSLFPKEASEFFADKLFPFIQDLIKTGFENAVIDRAVQKFNHVRDTI